MKKLPILILLIACVSLGLHAQKTTSSKAVSNALEFDGTDDFVQVVSGTALFANLDEFSMCGWVYATNPNAAWPDFDGFFGIKEELVCDFYVAQINGTGIEARITTNTGTYTINPPDLSPVGLDEWNHYALVYTGSELQLYLNGELDGSVSASGEILLNNLDLTFGKLVFGTNDFYLDGRLDEITFWSKALSADEILAYQCINEDPSGIEDLTAYYDFNEEEGLLLPDLLEGYDGDLTNMTGDEWLESEVCESGYTITFEVMDEVTALPVEGADVDLDGLVKTTGADGIAVFNNYDPGTYAYEVTQPDYYDASGEVTVVDTSITESVLLPPILYYSITFLVTEDPGGSPIDSAIVNLNGMLKYTDQTGTVVYEDFLPGTYTYNVSKTGYVLEPGSVEITDEDVTLEIGLAPLDTYSIQFLVYSNPGSDPIEGAEVDLEGELNYTDETGSAVFENYSPGTYNYTVSSEGFFSTSGMVEVVDEDVTVDIELIIDGVEDQRIPRLLIFPNPAKDYLTLSIPEADAAGGFAVLTDLSGVQVQEMRLKASNNTMNLTQQAPGLYLLKVSCSEWVATKLVVVW